MINSECKMVRYLWLDKSVIISLIYFFQILDMDLDPEDQDLYPSEEGNV